MGNPKLGMYYSDVKKRLKRITKYERNGECKDTRLASNLKESLLNQAKLHEGEKAVKELTKEVSPYYTGSGNKSCGFGEGSSKFDNSWDYGNDKWIKAY